jgi:probable rRNA maturation factor
MTKNVSIYFNHIVSSPLKQKTRLRQFLKKVIEENRKSLVELSYTFVSDDQLLELNRTHLKHDYYTDIITFNLSDDPDALWGDIYISIDRVRENAQAHQTGASAELLRVILHGLLHLLGLNDKTPQQRKKMRLKEDELLERYRST